LTVCHDGLYFAQPIAGRSDVPLLSRWFIRTGLLYFLVSLTIGLGQALIPSGLTVAWPTYLHLLVLGWVTQLIFGVAYWMFPRYLSPTQWFERMGWICYGCLNVGLLLRVVAESGPQSSLRAELFVVSAVLQLIAGWVFVIITWPRVRGR
jgi:hypothetical protein